MNRRRRLRCRCCPRRGRCSQIVCSGGAEAARVVMAKAVERLERSELSDDLADDAA